MLPLEVVKLLETAASHPEGEAALFEGHLESVAALYQVHPQTVEQLRACLDEPAAHAQARQIVERAHGSSPLLPERAIAAVWPNLASLVAKATSLPNGFELLTRGPIETAALQLGAHPFAVEEARLHLAARANGGPT